jgi:putative ABC transport system permease protein
MNLAYRDIRHNSGRFIFTGVGLGLLLGVVLSMIGIYRGMVVDALTIARTPAVDLWVVEAGSRGPFAESSRVPGETREAVARMPGVTAAGSVTYQNVEAVTGDRKIRLYVIGYEIGRPGGPAEIVAGRPIGRSHFEMVVDRSSKLVPGDIVSLGRDRFTVVGLTAYHVNSGGDPAAFVTLRDAQKYQAELDPAALRLQKARGVGSGSADTVSAVLARLSPHASVNSVAADIGRWKHLTGISQAEQEAILTGSHIDRARRQIGLFTGLLLAVSAVVIALIIYTMTMEKLKQIATLKLIGAPDRTIVAMVVQQALALGLIGFSMGWLLIVNIKEIFPRRIVLDTDNVAELGAVIIAVCLIASALGVRAALKVDPATALGG